MDEQMQVRVAKLEVLRQEGVPAYASRFQRTHRIAEAAELPDETDKVAVAGRVVAMRSFGKLMFCRLHDADGELQFALQKGVLGEDFARFGRLIDLGDFVGLTGQMFTSRTGEKTLDVRSWELLSKTLRPLPEKFHGLADAELRLRRRYLDLISSDEVRQRFKTRATVITAFRSYLDSNGFLEIDTPVLSNKASGALATPFTTHHEALDHDVYLRIAPETYLKRAVAGGFDRVYEMARCFRNEGMDPSHLPDFTMLEYYAAYWDWQDNMRFTRQMVQTVVNQVTGGLLLKHGGLEIDLGGEWPQLTFRDVIVRDCGIDIDDHGDAPSLRAAMADRGLGHQELDVDPSKASRGRLIDLLFKKMSRPKIIAPTFLTHHPIDISPLARRSDADGSVVDRFQLVVNGWEIVNAYSELVDPQDQRERLETQAAARRAGDTEAMDLDEDFLLCMEHGMPPMSGWGMGIDRFVALLTDAASLRDVVLFPLMRSE